MKMPRMFLGSFCRRIVRSHALFVFAQAVRSSPELLFASRCEPKCLRSPAPFARALGPSPRPKARGAGPWAQVSGPGPWVIGSVMIIAISIAEAITIAKLVSDWCGYGDRHHQNIERPESLRRSSSPGWLAIGLAEAIGITR